MSNSNKQLCSQPVLFSSNIKPLKVAKSWKTALLKEYEKHHDSLFQSQKEGLLFPGVLHGIEGGGSLTNSHDTLLKINMEHNSEGLVQMIFLCKWVIFMFHLNFPGC